jgi:hypothetical protein
LRPARLACFAFVILAAPGCALWDAATSSPAAPPAPAFANFRSLSTPARAIAVADVDGDGRAEVLLSDGLDLLAISADSDEPKRLIRLPVELNAMRVAHVGGDVDLVGVGAKQVVLVHDLAHPTRRSVTSVAVTTSSLFDLLADVQVDELSGDLYPDLLLRAAASTPSGNRDFFVLLVQDVAGTGRFDDAPIEVHPSQVGGAVALADVTGDDRDDLLVPQGAATPGRVAMLEGQLGGGFAAEVTFEEATGSGDPSGNLGADFDRDGENDLVLGFGSYASVYTGRGSVPPPRRQTLSLDAFGSIFATGDFDGDDRIDFVVHRASRTSLQLFRQQNLFTFAADPAPLDLGGYPTGLATGDLDDDRVDDLVVNLGGERVLVFLTRPPTSAR